jgi:hypothetical protein
MGGVDQVNAVSVAIWTQLKGGTALTTLLGGGTAGIYEDHAPASAVLPCVVFNEQAGTWEQTMGATRLTDVIYQVKGVSGSEYPKEARAIDEQIDLLLHNATLSVTGYGLLACTRESDVQYSETTADQVFQHAGGLYRVELQKT